MKDIFGEALAEFEYLMADVRYEIFLNSDGQSLDGDSELSILSGANKIFLNSSDPSAAQKYLYTALKLVNFIDIFREARKRSNGIQKSIQLLSQKVIDEYNRNGVVRLKGVLTDSEVNALRDDVDNQIARRRFSETAYDFEDLQKQQWSGADEFDGGNSDRFNLEMYKLVLDTDPEARPILDKVNDEESGMFFYDAGQWRFYEGIKKCAIDSALPHISAKLMDSSFVNFWEDTTFVKSPNTSQRTTFHQDWSYFQIKGEKCCIVWIPLDPVTEENGGMEYIRGSHLWGKTYAPNLLIAQSIDPMSPYEKLEDIESNIHKHDVIRFLSLIHISEPTRPY